MKASEIGIDGTTDALAEVLQSIGVSPKDATVYVREKPPVADGVKMMVATPIGLVLVTDTITSRFQEAWQLNAEVVPWKVAAPKVTVNVDRSKKSPALESEWTVSFGGVKDSDIHTNSYAEAKTPTGLEDFMAAVLRWTGERPGK